MGVYDSLRILEEKFKEKDEEKIVRRKDITLMSLRQLKLRLNSLENLTNKKESSNL
jgi:hypothetical protein